MAETLSLFERLQQRRAALESGDASGGRAAAPAAQVTPEVQQLQAELSRLQSSTDPISARPRARRIAAIQAQLAQLGM